MKTYAFLLALGLVLLTSAAVCLADGPTLEPRTLSGNTMQLTGVFEMLWGDPMPGLNLPPRYHFSLTDGQGVVWTLAVSEDQLQAAGGMLALKGKTVTVTGIAMAAQTPKLAVQSIALTGGIDQGKTPRKASVSKPYVWILLRFADNTTFPETRAWFETQAWGPRPSLDHYWREASYGNINLTGSDVVGWYTLPHNRSYYVYDIDPGSPGDEVSFNRILDDAVALADPDVNFPAFVGVNLILNGVLDGAAWGGTRSINADGQNRAYGITWMPPNGWGNQGILAHEMGHALGLPHSSGPYTQTYDSKWCVMSSAFGTGAQWDPTYGTLGELPCADYKDFLGWITAAQKFELPAAVPMVATGWLDDASVTPAPGSLLLARVYWPGDPTRSYTFERRRFTGYDQNVCDETVVMHSINPTTGNRAIVVDVDGNGDCNDEAARWDLGETFWDTAYGIVMTVEYVDAVGSVITVSNRGRAAVYVDRMNGGTEDGTSMAPWNTVWEGQGAVYPTGTVYIAPTSYDEQKTIRKGAIVLAAVGHDRLRGDWAMTHRMGGSMMRILLIMAMLALSISAAIAVETILPTGTVTGGGTAWVNNANFGVQGSVGQTFAGATMNAATTADAGFWTCLYVEKSPAGWINPGWNWIGVPSHPAFPAPATIFTLDPVNRLYVWDWVAKTVFTYADDFRTMESGTGYVALAMVGQGEDPRYSGFLPITPLDDDTAPDYRSVTVQIPAAGVIWLGHPMPWPVDLSSVKVRYGATVRTAAEDNASPAPWLNWNWTYWDSAVDTALICGFTGADDDTLRPWRHYRIWFNIPAAPNDPNGPFLIIPEPTL